MQINKSGEANKKGKEEEKEEGSGVERKKEKILNWSTNTPSEQFVVLCLRSLRKRRRTTVTFAFLLLECFSNPRVGIYFSVTSPFVVTTKNTTLSATWLFCCPTETLALHPRNQKKSNFSFNYFSILTLSFFLSPFLYFDGHFLFSVVFLLFLFSQFLFFVRSSWLHFFCMASSLLLFPLLTVR